LFTGTLFGPERTVRAGVACLLIDLAVAGYFVELRGAAILWFALAGGLIAVFFTPLMLRGLKEPVESGILLIVGYGITITLQSRLPSDRHSVATTMLLEVK